MPKYVKNSQGQAVKYRVKTKDGRSMKVRYRLKPSNSRLPSQRNVPQSQSRNALRRGRQPQGTYNFVNDNVNDGQAVKYRVKTKDKRSMKVRYAPKPRAHRRNKSASEPRTQAPKQEYKAREIPI